MPPDITVVALSVGLGCAIAISFAAWKLRALSASGAIMAAFVGAIVFVGGGMAPSLALIAFFLSGSLLSRLPKPAIKESVSRDWKQVCANGGVGSLAIVLVQLHCVGASWVLVYYGSLAAAAADTWATEIGTRFGGEPFDLVRLRRIDRGLSGGISLAGTVATCLGAIAIGAVASTASSLLHYGASRVFWAVSAGGIAGSLADTIAGGLFQAKFSCPVCCTKTEQRLHCGMITERVSGIYWVQNNTVNLMATLVGGIIALGVLDFP